MLITDAQNTYCALWGFIPHKATEGVYRLAASHALAHCWFPADKPLCELKVASPAESRCVTLEQLDTPLSALMDHWNTRQAGSVT